MSIKSSRALLNGTWTDLTYNNSTGYWEAEITAPNVTSYNQDGGYYPITLEATNDAGTVSTIDSSDAALGDALKLVVKETVAPVITISNPTSGATLTTNKPSIVVRITDETNGSGVDPSTFQLTVDGTVYTQDSSGMTASTITNGYQFTFVPETVLTDGSHTILADCSDNDGNAAAQKSVSVIVDTTPPVLNVTAPADGLITSAAACIVRGTTNDATSSPVTVTVKLNSNAEVEATVDSSGNFEKSISLAEGTNTIVITATDAAGKSSSVTRTVTLDTSVPKFTELTITPNPVNTSKTVKIQVKIE